MSPQSAHCLFHVATALSTHWTPHWWRAIGAWHLLLSCSWLSTGFFLSDRLFFLWTVIAQGVRFLGQGYVDFGSVQGGVPGEG